MLKQLPGLMGRANGPLGFRALRGSSGRSSLQLSGRLYTNRLMSTATLFATREMYGGVACRFIGTSGDVVTRKYSSGSTRYGPSGLQTALSNEIIEETANDEVDSELEVIQKQIMKDFTMEETLGISVVTLKRNFKNEEITVTFDCQDESEESAFDDELLSKYEEGGDAENEEDDEEDYDDDIKYGINFTVSIKKNNSEMIVDCIADSSIKISSLKVLSADDKNVEERYKGPPFENLSEPMQDAILNFLEDRKIDPDLCHFILSFSQYKEQKEYVQWLKSLADFTA